MSKNSLINQCISIRERERENIGILQLKYKCQEENANNLRNVRRKEACPIRAKYVPQPTKKGYRHRFQNDCDQVNRCQHLFGFGPDG